MFEGSAASIGRFLPRLGAFACPFAWKSPEHLAKAARSKIADEFGVLAFAWMTFIGAAVVQRSDGHMTIEYFVKDLRPRVQAVVYALRVAAIAAVAIVLAWQGIALTQQMSFIEYPAMEISRGFLFATLPVTMPLLFVYLIASALPRLRAAWSGKRIFEEHVEDDPA